MPHDIAYSLTQASPDGDFLTLRDLLSGYYAAVQGIDDNVGRLIQKLKERGIRENTLIVYTSDNGFSCGQHGVWGKGNATMPLNLYDTAVKVPCLFNMPGAIREKAASLKSRLDAWFLEYVDPAIDAAREPVQGRGQLCKVGPASAGQLTFHPATDVEYRR